MKKYPRVECRNLCSPLQGETKHRCFQKKIIIHLGTAFEDGILPQKIPPFFSQWEVKSFLRIKADIVHILQIACRETDASLRPRVRPVKD